MSKNKIGLTVNGIQEVCRWNQPTLCPRHRMHFPKGQKITSTVHKMEDSEETVDATTATLEDYNNSKEIPTAEDLEEDKRLELARRTFVKVDDNYYRLNNNGYTLDIFRYVESPEDFTEEEFNQAIENGHIIIDDVIYKIESDGYFEVEHKDVHAPYMRLQEWFIPSVNMTVSEYIEKHGGKNNILAEELEHAYMFGGCAVYALALKEIYPEYDIAVEKTDDAGIITYEHVFCVNRETGEAYDVRGKFSTAEKLYDYTNDPVMPSYVSNSNSVHEFFTIEGLKDLIDEGFFKYDDTEDDIFITKKLIQNFNPRIS